MTVRTCCIAFCIALIALATACSADTTALSIKNISAEKAKIIVDSSSAFILDVRTEEEYAEERIAGSFLIPVQDMPEGLSKIDSLKQKPILVYCRSGRRSLGAANIMIKQGFLNVTNMEGGINAWKEKAFPVEKNTAPRN